jgi:Spy/CpxP family protein refolding chaperone
MKLFKYLIPALALGVMASAPIVHAQDQNPPAEGRKGGRGGRGMSPEQQVARLDEALSLTADQKTKITDILTKAQEQVQALPQEDRREKGMEIRQNANKEVRAVLTEEQQKKFDEMMARGPGRGRGKKKDN